VRHHRLDAPDVVEVELIITCRDSRVHQPENSRPYRARQVREGVNGRVTSIVGAADRRVECSLGPRIQGICIIGQ